MEKKTNALKTSIVRIMQILEKYSDANHPLLHGEIADLLAKEYGVTLERKAIGNNVKLLTEMFSGEDSTIRIVTKRKSGTYLEKGYMEDKDVQYLSDLVMSSYSITEEHRRSLYDKVRQMGSVSFRNAKPRPDSFKLIDEYDDDLGTINDEVDDDTVNVFRKAMREKRSLAFDYALPGADGNHYIGFLPIHVGIYNGCYYAYCYTAAKEYTWVRLSCVYGVQEEDAAPYVPTLGAFITAREHAGYPNKDVDYNHADETFVLVVDSVLGSERLKERFGTNITFSEIAKGRPYTAEFRSTWENVRSFIGEYWESVVVVSAPWSDEEMNRKRLLAYAKRHKIGDEN